MIDAYVYAELRKLLIDADVDVFGTRVITEVDKIDSVNFNKFSQALYPLLNEYFEAKNKLKTNKLLEEIKAYQEIIKDLEKSVSNSDYEALENEQDDLIEEFIEVKNDVLFYKSIIKKFLEIK